MRKKDETLRRTILEEAKEMLKAAGPESIHIRTIAKRVGIATGTVYNYFYSKEDILLALTEEYWHEALLEMREAVKAESFLMQIEQMYAFLSGRIRHSAGGLMGSLHSVEAMGRERMQSMQQHLGGEILRCIQRDEAIRADIWNEAFTKEQYAQFILMNLLLLLQVQAADIGFLTQIIKRTLY